MEKALSEGGSSMFSMSAGDRRRVRSLHCHRGGISQTLGKLNISDLTGDYLGVGGTPFVGGFTCQVEKKTVRGSDTGEWAAISLKPLLPLGHPVIR